MIRVLIVLTSLEQQRDLGNCSCVYLVSTMLPLSSILMG